MPAAIKYSGTFTDRYGKIVTVILFADDSAGPFEAKQLSFAEDPVVISYDGDDEDIFQAMIPSKATIKLMIGEDDADLLEDINSMTENTFGVLIRINNPAPTPTLQYFWEGWLVPDEQVRTFSYTPQSMTLTAIDPISRSKGQKLLNPDGSYIYGKQTIKYIVDRCLTGVFTPDTSTASYTLVVDSDLTLSNTTSTVLPGIFEQIKVHAEAFNDDAGRPISAFNALEMIAKALFMRVFYENGNIYFIDMLQYSLVSSTPSIPLNNVFFANDFTVEGTNTLLIKNSENITRTRTYRESICKFTYENAIGLLLDGNLINWTSIFGGYKLTQWYYNPYLFSRSDVYSRRSGNGRAENEYGMMIKYTSEHVSGDDYQNRKFDVICSKTSDYVYAGQSFTLDISVKMAHPELIPYALTVDGWQNIAMLPVFVYIYNNTDPALSCYLNKDGAWETVDLTGSDFDTIGSPDWVKVLGAVDAGLNPGAPSSYKYQPFKVISDVGNSMPITLQAVSNIQDVSLDIPAIPTLIGTMYVFVYPGVNTRSDLSSDGTETIIQKVLLSSNVSDTNNGKYSGEIQYISRQIRTSKDNSTREISFNTTNNKAIAGSLSTAVNYVEGVSTILAGTNMTKICLKDYPEPLYSGVSLMAYNAIAQMWLNYAQYKIDIETIGTRNKFYDGIYLGAFYDGTKPSTEIYQNIFIQNRSSYNLKDCTRSLTVVSTKSDQRAISENTIDATHDLSEFYYLK